LAFVLKENKKFFKDFECKKCNCIIAYLDKDCGNDMFMGRDSQKYWVPYIICPACREKNYINKI
jgi:hypothetical protein